MSCQRTIFSRSCIRIAEEVQLQAEEEWIVEGLRKIKQQRNCLQIERLHLESLKSQLNEPMQRKADKEREELEQHVSAVTMMNPALGTRNHEPDIDQDTLCNEEELNLVVTRPMYEMPTRTAPQFDFDIEEEDEDDDDEDDDEDGDNVMIDISMLMNGSSKRDDL